MYENDIEWFKADAEDSEEVKKAIWDDADFQAFVQRDGLEEALYRVSDFHKNLATQLKARGVTHPSDSEWASRAIGLTVQAKRRRQQLRRAVRTYLEDGDEIVARIRDEVEEDWSD